MTEANPPKPQTSRNYWEKTSQTNKRQEKHRYLYKDAYKIPPVVYF